MSIAELDRSRALFGDAPVMGDDQDRRAESLVEILDQTEDFLAGMSVEVAGRLIGEQDRWVNRQRSRDRHALAFTSRKFFRQMIETVSELYEFQQLARAFLDFFSRPVAQVQW
jgi:hypothetical protein